MPRGKAAQAEVIIPKLREVEVELAWYPRLLHPTPQLRSSCVIAGGGYGIHWPEIDEDLSVDGLLRGAPAPRVSAKAS